MLAKKPEISAAGCSIRSHLGCLRFLGFCRLSPNYPENEMLRSAHEIYRKFSLFIKALYLFQQGVYAYQVYTDLERFSRVMFYLMVFFSDLMKLLVFHYDADRIDKLINALDDPDFNENTAESKALQQDCADSALKLHWNYTGAAIITCVLWAVFPAVLFAQGQPVQFFFWSAVDYSNLQGFLVVSVYSYYATTMNGIGNTTMDAFMATIFYQCKVQFSILSKNLGSLFEKADMMHTETGESYETCVMKLLAKCLEHHKKICQEVLLLQDIFGTALLVQFTIGGWVLGMTFYKLATESVRSIEFVSTILFIFCILTELFIYCYSGNEVFLESDRISDAVYSSSWQTVRAPQNNRHAMASTRRALVLVMAGARPLQPLAGWVIPMSLETYLKILKASYSFYTFLRQTKDN